MSTAVTPEEFAWRAWFLGEGQFKAYGRRSLEHRHETGAPAKVPAEWWVRLEEFLSRRSEDKEKPPAPPTYPAPGPAGTTLVSAHFAVHEFDCHDGRKTPAAAVPALVRLAAVFLEPLRAEFGTVFVTSGYRPVDYNRAIGGAPQSQHIYELTPEAVAADVIPKHGSPASWGRALRQIADKARVGGVGVYATFTHIDNAGRRDW
jgi:hypothetical protein